MKTVAIIGVTGYGQTHLNAILRLHRKGELFLRAAVVVNPKEAAMQLAELEAVSCQIYPTADAMWAEQTGKIDLCLIPVPIALHAPLSIAALRAGANVLVEKPLAGTVQEVRAMMDVEAETGRFIAVGFQDLYSPEVRAVKERIVDGAIGTIRSVRCYGLWPRPPSYYSRNNWAGQVRMGEDWVLDSPVSNAMAHFLNIELFLAGREQWTMARPATVEADLYRVKDTPNFDTAALRITTEDDVEIFFAASHGSHDKIEPILRVEGSAGTIEWAHCSPFCISRVDGDEVFPWTDYSEVRKNMLLRVLARIDDPSVPVCTTSMAFVHVSVVNALYESALITDIPPDFKEEQAIGGENSLGLIGIGNAIRKAFKQGKLFRELDLPWAKSDGRPFAMRAYASFEGGLLNVSARETQAR